MKKTILLPISFVVLCLLLRPLSYEVAQWLQPDLLETDSQVAALASLSKFKIPNNGSSETRVWLYVTPEQRKQISKGKPVKTEGVAEHPTVPGSRNAEASAAAEKNKVPVAAEIVESPFELFEAEVYLWMKVGLSIAFSLASLFIVLREYPPQIKHWAYGTIGMILGTWFRS